MFPFCYKNKDKSSENKKSEEEQSNVKNTSTDIEDSINLLNKNKAIKK